ncbi:MAG: hypothetical protein KGD64_11895 [Candidatus Heimdallarchaeota archaeon]|nr:hypothetical protein [Candidatus Heimdallarchaeota archaeon]
MTAAVKKTNLESCLVHEGVEIIEDFCIDYFKNCDFSSDYKLDAVCSAGLVKLFCGYFKGSYGIIEIEMVGLYPGEVDDIHQNLIGILQEKVNSIPRRKGLELFNYDISEGRVVLRFYACKSNGEKYTENEDVIRSVYQLSPALEFIADYLKKRAVGK